MKITILVLSLAAIAYNLISCTKLYEEVRLEVVYRPKIEIDSLTTPDWEVIPQK